MTGYSLKAFILFILVLATGLIQGQEINLSDWENHCVSDEERKLYNLITSYRAEHQLPSLEFSISLSYVARMHAMDLQANRPDFGGCNLHSWSDKGKWKPCCYAKDENRIACMNQKPKEITGYKHKAWEVVYYGGETAKAEDAFNLWMDIELMKDYLLNTGKWVKPWSAIGVGIYGDYACVWFGEGVDIAGNVRNCSDTVLADTIRQKGGLYRQTSDDKAFYIIIGSVSTKEQAETEVRKLVEKGYSTAGYMPGNSFIRIVIARLFSEASAYKELDIIKKQYPQSWLLKPKIVK